MNRVLIVLIVVLPIINVVGQNRILTGKVVDNQTRLGVPFAGLVLHGSSVGTASDENGEFSLVATPNVDAKIIHVSSIGYKPRMLDFDSLLKSDVLVTIELQREIVILDEVVILEKRYDAEQLVIDAIAAVPVNYYQKPYNQEFLSKIVVRDSMTELFRLETVILNYRDGYTPGSMNSSTVLQKREFGVDPFPRQRDKKSKTERSNYSPPFPVFFTDLLSPEFKGYSVFNPATRKKFTFRFEGVSRVESDTVCIVQYSSRNDAQTAKKEPRYEGRLYISPASGAILKHEISIGSRRYSVIYRKFRDTYFPYVITENSVQRAGARNLTISNQVNVIRMEFEEVVKIDMKNRNLYFEDVPYDEKFWSDR